jgi:hypothetical protein
MGTLTVTGKAPHALRWEFVPKHPKGPMWVVHGEKIAGGWGARWRDQG